MYCIVKDFYLVITKVQQAVHQVLVRLDHTSAHGEDQIILGIGYSSSGTCWTGWLYYLYLVGRGLY